MLVREQIEVAAAKLGQVCPHSAVVDAAKSWLRTGSLYSNHDLDVLSALKTATYNLPK